ncbi:MAG: hypothetical protein JXR03_21150 [Cyclobacteriaceae bacterium]
MEEEIDKLITQGKTFNFRNNSETKSHGTYSKASDELLGWAASVEDFIISNYGEQSGPYKLYSSFNREHLTGYYEDHFQKELNILIGSLKACKTASPIQKPILKEDNQILSLIKNPIFWTVFVVITGASFALGLRFGNSKFDKEKSELFDNNKELKRTLDKQTIMIQQKDSLIETLKMEIKSIQK